MPPFVRYLFALGLLVCAGQAVAQRGSTPETAPASGEAPADTTRRVAEQVREDTPARTGDEVYQRQLLRIKSQVDELKEEIFRSRTRLTLLKETVLASGLAGSEVHIIHRNEMSSNFRLERMIYILDGTILTKQIDQDGSLDRQEQLDILDGTIIPGNHTLQVEMIYRGNGFGIFSYLQSYRFGLGDVHSFRAEEGKRVVIRVIGYERGGATLDLRERPTIRFEKEVLSLEEAEQQRTAAEQ